jgi:hypothetical protein
MKNIPGTKLIEETNFSKDITNRSNTRIRSKTQSLYHAALSHIEPTSYKYDRSGTSTKIFDEQDLKHRVKVNNGQGLNEDSVENNSGNEEDKDEDYEDDDEEGYEQ